jgi:dTDP-4-dehydrorhamnose 3,5-epimerase
MSRLEVGSTTLPGVYVIKRSPRADSRGWFERMYSVSDLAEILGNRTIAHINRTLTRKKSTVRGMHYQVPPFAEAKIVSCLRGAAFDVAIDLRRESPTLLEWHAEVITEQNRRSLFIPEGFAHGFQAISDECELLYLHTAAYDANAERGVHPQDPRVAVDWPLPIGHMSDRDDSRQALPPDFDGILT